MAGTKRRIRNGPLPKFEKALKSEVTRAMKN
jgi:hypothetical protein